MYIGKNITKTLQRRNTSFHLRAPLMDDVLYGDRTINIKKEAIQVNSRLELISIVGNLTSEVRSLEKSYSKSNNNINNNINNNNIQLNKNEDTNSNSINSIGTTYTT